MAWIFIGVGIAFFLLLCWRFSGETPKTFGSARWSTVWEAFRAGLLKQRGLRVGDLTGRLGIFHDGTHAITFGVSGSGKGVSAIVPNILSSPYVFLVDPGGENTAIAIKHWRARRVPFSCINFFSMFAEEPWALPAHGFNPLRFLNAQSPTFAADALLFAEMLTPRAGNEGGSSAYFKDAAQSAKRAMLVHIKTSEPPARQNIGTLYEYVNGSADEWTTLLAAMRANPACGDLARNEALKLERIETQAPEEFSAIMSTIQQDLSFLADPLMREMLSRDDVDFSLLKGRQKRQRGGVISVVLPLEYIESHAAITRLALACAIRELQHLPLAKKKVVFLIDEAAALSKIERFPNWLATLRKYRVTIWSVWQNIGQVAHLYANNWQTMISNCGLVQLLAVGDLQTAEYTEKMLGRCTVNSVAVNARGDRSTSESARSLLTADELLCLKSNRQIAFIGNLRPLYLKKTPYWKIPALGGRFHPNPYFDGRAAGAGPIDHLAALWGSIYRSLVWLMAPHPVVACLITVAFAIIAFGHFNGAGR